MAEAVLDASALVDLLLRRASGEAVRERIRDESLHAPAHLDAEVLSVLGRLHRAGTLDDARVGQLIRVVVDLPVQRHPVAELLSGAWDRRHRVRLVDALYLELAARLAAPLVTTDRRLRHEPLVEVVDARED